MLRKYVDEVHKYIIQLNSLDSLDAIPHSDVFFKRMMSERGFDEALMIKIISILKESHYIFVMEITREDKNRQIRGIDGFVDANLDTVRRLFALFQRALMEAYEKQYRKPFSYQRIIKDLLHRMDGMKNTLVGGLVNKAMMLNEFGLLLSKRLPQYAEAWKTEKLEALIREDEKQFQSNDKGKEAPARLMRRAVDTPEYEKFEKQSGNENLSKIIAIYGFSFFARVHLRKYKFRYLERLVDSGEISKIPDLALLHEMLQKVKTNFDLDHELKNYAKEIDSLESALLKILSSNEP